LWLIARKVKYTQIYHTQLWVVPVFLLLYTLSLSLSVPLDLLFSSVHEMSSVSISLSLVHLLMNLLLCAKNAEKNAKLNYADLCEPSFICIDICINFMLFFHAALTILCICAALWSAVVKTQIKLVSISRDKMGIFICFNNSYNCVWLSVYAKWMQLTYISHKFIIFLSLRCKYAWTLDHTEREAQRPSAASSCAAHVAVNVLM
jgi:hypothetical protein